MMLSTVNEVHDWLMFWKDDPTFSDVKLDYDPETINIKRSAIVVRDHLPITQSFTNDIKWTMLTKGGFSNLLSDKKLNEGRYFAFDSIRIGQSGDQDYYSNNEADWAPIFRNAFLEISQGKRIFIEYPVCGLGKSTSSSIFHLGESQIICPLEDLNINIHLDFKEGGKLNGPMHTEVILFGFLIKT